MYAYISIILLPVIWGCKKELLLQVILIYEIWVVKGVFEIRFWTSIFVQESTWPQLEPERPEPFQLCLGLAWQPQDGTLQGFLHGSGLRPAWGHRQTVPEWPSKVRGHAGRTSKEDHERHPLHTSPVGASSRDLGLTPDPRPFNSYPTEHFNQNFICIYWWMC